MKFSIIIIVIYTNRDVIFDIAKQITFIISSTNKFNFRFIRISNYIQRFNIELRHKFDVQHIIFDVLFRFVNFNANEKKRIDDDDELNVFFIITLIKMKKKIRNHLLKDYVKNFV